MIKIAVLLFLFEFLSLVACIPNVGDKCDRNSQCYGIGDYSLCNSFRVCSIGAIGDTCNPKYIDCTGDNVCINGKCNAGKDFGGACTSDDECSVGTCINNKCAPSASVA